MRPPWLGTLVIVAMACGGTTPPPPTPEPRPEATADAGAGTVARDIPAPPPDAAVPDARPPRPAAGSFDGTRLVFGPLMPEVGEWVRHDSEMAMMIDATVGTGKSKTTGQQTQSDKEQRTEEALEVDGDVVTVLQVTYGDQWAEASGPNAGQTYVVRTGADGALAYEQAGDEVSVSESNRLDQTVLEVGRPAFWIKMVSAQELVVGKKVKVKRDRFATLIDRLDPDMKVDKATMTLVGVDGDLATIALDVTARATQPSFTGDVKITATFHHTLTFSVARGRPLRWAVEGTMKGKRKGMSFVAKLTVADDMTWSE